MPLTEKQKNKMLLKTFVKRTKPLYEFYKEHYDWINNYYSFYYSHSWSN